MIDRFFFDTNVLVYLFDSDNPGKKEIAASLLASLGLAGNAMISTQVLQEFYVAVTRKLARPLQQEAAAEAVKALTSLPVIQVSTETVLNAIGTCQQERISFWDALIIQSALEGGCRKLYSEDMQDGRAVGGLEISNPFL
jgi:predicted nucleic acid-binding protein